VVGASCFVVALGASTPLGPILYRLPVYGQFRAWARYLVGVDLVVALLAGAGVVVLRRASGGERRAAVARSFAAVLVLVGLAAAAPRLAQVGRSIPPGSDTAFAVGAPLAFAVVALSLAWLWRSQDRRRAWAAGALVAVVALDGTLSFGAFYEWRRNSPTPAALRRDKGSGQASWGRVTDQPGGIDRYLF